MEILNKTFKVINPEGKAEEIMWFLDFLSMMSPWIHHLYPIESYVTFIEYIKNQEYWIFPSIDSGKSELASYENEQHV